MEWLTVWFTNLLNLLFNKDGVPSSLLESQPKLEDNDYESTGYVALSELDRLAMEIEGCRLMLQDAKDAGDMTAVADYKQDLVRLLDKSISLQEQKYRSGS
jgi:hypothetical protein